MFYPAFTFYVTITLIVSQLKSEHIPETMQWLEQMLEKYRGSTIIFLSHHNVLYAAGENRYSSNLINNPGLPALLRENGVELIMTGHMHFPYILEKDGLWEILSGMPFSGQHLLGNLVIGQDKTDELSQSSGQGQTDELSKSSGQDQTDDPVRAVYYAEPIDFASYDKTTAEKLEKLDRESSDAMTRTLSELLDREGLRGSKKRKVLNLISLYFQYYYSGSLAEAAEELKNDPSYETMIQALWDYNYGPWIKEMVETTTHSSRELEITFSP